MVVHIARLPLNRICETLSNVEMIDVSTAPPEGQRTMYVDTLYQLPIVYLSLPLSYLLQDLFLLINPNLKFRVNFLIRAQLFLS